MLKRRAKEMMRRVKSLDRLIGYIYSEKDGEFLVCLPLRIKKAERRYSAQFGPLLSEERKKSEEEKRLFMLTDNASIQGMGHTVVLLLNNTEIIPKL